MSNEQLGRNEEHEGVHYLRLLGLEHLADREVAGKNGRFLAKDFLDVCGQHARPVLVGFEDMSSDDPEYESTKDFLTHYIGQILESHPQA